MDGVIFLVAIGAVAPEILTYLRQAIETTFRCECALSEPLPVPEHAFVAQRGQYSARILLERLYRCGAERALGVVDLDLFVPGLNFVFGLADPIRMCAVIALPRLRESFYGGQENHALFLKRAAKEAVHELGHTYGFWHCSDPSCVMAFSNSLQDTDYKGMEFCSKCRRKLEK